MTGRIDVHHHLVPPSYAALLRERGLRPGGVDVPEWTPERSIKVMRRNGIATSILSLSTPGVWFGHDAEARRLARQVNEYAAGVVADHPTRFGFFGVLPLPDVEGSLAMIDHTLDDCSADGIGVLANNAGRYIYEPEFESVLQHLHDRRAVVFLHPGQLPAEPAPGIPGSPRTSSSTRSARPPGSCSPALWRSTTASGGSSPTRAASSPTSPTA